jgi:hypothetical protein
MTPEDQAGVHRVIFMVEDHLRLAIDVEREFEILLVRLAKRFPARSRRDVARHFRTLLRPLADLELNRRADQKTTRKGSGYA